MAIAVIVERLSNAYAPSSFTVATEGDAYRVKFNGIDFSDPLSSRYRELVKKVLSMDYKIEDDFTDFVISEV